MASTSDKLTVAYLCVNGSHFFIGTKASPLTEGLCVGSRNLKQAFEQVTPALTFLLKANHGIQTDLTSAMSFPQFKQWALAKVEENASVDELEPISNHIEHNENIGAALLWTLPKQATHHM